jgi:hypothetical protein
VDSIPVVETPSSKVPAYIAALQFEEDRAKDHASLSDALILGAKTSTNNEISEEVLEELNDASSAKVIGRFESVDSRNQMALTALEEVLQHEQATANFVELKAETEAVMDELLK